MGFANSTCSFTRFRILDSVPDALWPQIPDKLRQSAFRDIDDIPEMQAQGWVCFEDMLDSEWAAAPPQKGAYIVFSLRLDIRRIPAGVVKKHLALALCQEKERMREQNKTFISRERKKELKEQVMLRLRQRFLPVPGEFNVLWATDKNEVWFASTQNRMIDLFMEEFLKTFELHLEQLTPYTLAASMLDEESLIRLDQLEATQFAPLS
jgi:Putative exonuclease, RdgC.